MCKFVQASRFFFGLTTAVFIVRYPLKPPLQREEWAKKQIHEGTAKVLIVSQYAKLQLSQ